MLAISRFTQDGETTSGGAGDEDRAAFGEKVERARFRAGAVRLQLAMHGLHHFYVSSGRQTTAFLSKAPGGSSDGGPILGVEVNGGISISKALQFCREGAPSS